MEIKKISNEQAEELLAHYNPNAVLQGRYYAAFEDGVIKGCVGLLWRSWYLTEIRHLYVNPEYRRNGVATFLIREALKRASTPLVCCTVRCDNEASMELFKKFRFKIIEEFTNPETKNSVALLIRSRE